MYYSCQRSFFVFCIFCCFVPYVYLSDKKIIQIKIQKKYLDNFLTAKELTSIANLLFLDVTDLEKNQTDSELHAAC